MILSGAMLLDFIGWREASAAVVDAFARVLASGRMTADLAGGRPGITALSTADFGAAVAEGIETGGAADRGNGSGRRDTPGARGAPGSGGGDRA
jgi:hypothetical protein